MFLVKQSAISIKFPFELSSLSVKINGLKTIFTLRIMYYSVSDRGIIGKRKTLVVLSGVESKTFRLLALDALPMIYRRIVGAKVIKQSSWDKHPKYS